MHKEMNEAMSNGTPNGAASMVGGVGQVTAVVSVVIAVIAGCYLL